MPRFDGVIGLVAFLILAYILFTQEGAGKIFNSFANNSSTIIKALQGK